MSQVAIAPTILIVDDQPSVLGVLKRLLLADLPASTIVTADGGDAALGVIAEHPVRLVITDLQMPDMNGLHLATIVKARWPAIRVVLISGSDIKDVMRQVPPPPIDGYLLKPFNRAEIAGVVRAALGDGGAS